MNSSVKKVRINKQPGRFLSWLYTSNPKQCKVDYAAVWLFLLRSCCEHLDWVWICRENFNLSMTLSRKDELSQFVQWLGETFGIFRR